MINLSILAGFIVLACASFLPMLLVLKWSELVLEKKRRKQLLNEKILREPGYSLRLEIEQLGEKINENAISVVILPFHAGLVLVIQKAPPWLFLIVTGLLVAMSLRFGLSQVKLKKKRLNCIQGLYGEIIVSQQLDTLREAGYVTLHDVPMQYGNIDHVAVGMGGVFAVECKTRRKVINAADETAYKVEYKQAALHFPDGRNEEMIRQAERQAIDLAKYLSRLVGASVEVTPVLVLPGWYIDRLEKPPFPIVNHKEVGRVMRKGRHALTPVQVEQIVATLEERCRDVVV